MLTFVPAFRRFAQRFTFAMVICIIFSAIGIVSVNAVINARFDNIKQVTANVAPDTGMTKPANFLLIGSDTRAFVKTDEDKKKFVDAQGEEGQRSDTMMIIHVDPKAHKAFIMAIPRDTVVNIPGIGKTKINAAYNTDLGGGVDKLIETIKVNFDVDIHHYVNMDFQSFQEIVKALGSVNVWFDNPARDKKSGLNTQGKAGCIALDAPNALTYVRSRYYEEFVNGKWVEDPTSGVGRIKRQQDFMKRVATIAIRDSLGDLSKGSDVVDGVIANIQVDQHFTKSTIFKLTNTFKKVDPNDAEKIIFETLPVVSKFQNGSWNDVIQEDEAEVMLEELRTTSSPSKDEEDFSKNLPAASTVKLRTINTTTQKGFAAAINGQFTSKGFLNAGTGNAAKKTKTEIHYIKGAKAKAQLVSTYVDATLVEDSTIVDADVVLYIGTDFAALKEPGKASKATQPTTTQADVTSTSPTTKKDAKPTGEAACKA